MTVLKNKLSFDRRDFLRAGGLSALSLALGAEIVFGRNLSHGVVPLGLMPLDDPLALDGKHQDLTVLNDRPWNVETPPHLLDPDPTPADRLFIRNNGLVPRHIDPENWTLEVEGESVVSRKTYRLADLKSKFPNYTHQLTIECGGNGRSEHNPPAKGNQWTTGAVGCPEWTGVRLKDVLEDTGIREDAVYLGYYGRDRHLSGNPDKVVISRGVPLKKALEQESLIAWAVNGKDLPVMNGYPLRLVFGGWPASTCGKWLYKIVVRDKEHDGPKMGGQSYRVPCQTVAPGSIVPDEDMCIIESMPVKSLVTYPKTGAMIQEGSPLEIRGHAWAGDLEVTQMHCSIDFGASWLECQLNLPKNKLAWQNWNTNVKFPRAGYYEVWARATDSQGKMQPMVVPGWNPRGYLNNACHRIAIKVT